MAEELEFSEELKVKQAARMQTGRKRLLPYYVLLLAILWLEMFFTVGCIVTVTPLSINKSLLCAGAAVCGIVWTIFFYAEKRRRFLLLIVYAAAAGVLLFMNRALFVEGLFYIENVVIRLIRGYYGIAYVYHPVSAEEKTAVSVFLVFALQAVGACYAQVLFRARAAFFAALLFAAAAFSGLAVGVVPDSVFFIGAVFCVLLQFVLGRMRQNYCLVDGQVIKRDEGSRKMRAKAAFFMGVLIAGTGIIASLIVSERTYWDRMDVRAKKKQLQERFEEIAAMPVWEEIADRVSGMLKSGGSGKKGSTAKSGGLNNGRFSSAAQVTFDNVTALIVTLPEMEQSVYLKGYNGAVYTSSGWEALGGRAEKEYQRIAEEYGITAQGQGYALLDMLLSNKGPVLRRREGRGEHPIITRGSMQIEFITANRSNVYAPYFINPLERGSYEYEEDGYLSPDTQTDFFDFTFLLPSQEFLEWFADTAEKNYEDGTDGKFYVWQQSAGAERYRQFAREYRQFVYEHYTELPKGHEELAGLVRTADDASTADKIKAVQQYLSRYEYTLSPGDLPKNKDFVNYFLFENKKGYCVHFASSAVLMLRSLGVPARYAEGYLVTAQDIARADAVSAEIIDEKWAMDCLLYDSYSFAIQDSDVVLQKRVEVRDYSGHAWVEVYVDDIGWIPVEVTSGYMGGGMTESRPQELIAEVNKLPAPTPVPTRSATPTPLPTNTPAPTKPAEATKEPGITDDPEKTDKPEMTDRQDVSPGVTKQPAAGNEIVQEKGRSFRERIAGLPAWAKTILKVCVAAGCLIFLIFLRYHLVWGVRRKKKRTRRSRVLWYYDRMERMLSMQGIRALPQEGYEAFAKRAAKEGTGAAETFAACQQIALAAGFGRAYTEEEEVGFMEENYRKMRDEFFAKCGSVKKWYVKFIKLY